MAGRKTGDNQRPILVPVDFSPHSEEALLKGCELAECMQLPLVALHVVHDPVEMPGYYQKLARGKNFARIEDAAREAFGEFIDAVTKRHPEEKKLREMKTMMVVGLPVSRILEVADQIHAAMVVMGSQGRTGLSHLMLGSKAEQVVRLCPVPVTIVKWNRSG